MAGFLFCVGDMGDMMNAKGTVTREILDMCDENPKIAYINADGTGKEMLLPIIRKNILIGFLMWVFRR